MATPFFASFLFFLPLLANVNSSTVTCKIDNLYLRTEKNGYWFQVRQMYILLVRMVGYLAIIVVLTTREE